MNTLTLALYVPLTDFMSLSVIGIPLSVFRPSLEIALMCVVRVILLEFGLSALRRFALLLLNHIRIRPGELGCSQAFADLG